MNLTFGDTEQHEWGQQPSRRGFYAMGLVALLMIGWLIYARVFLPVPQRPVAEAAVRLTNGLQRPLQPPPEPEPQKSQAQKPQAQRTEPDTRPAARPQEESDEQKMHRKMRLLAHYSRPTAMGVGSDGRRLSQHQPPLQTEVNDSDVPRESVPHQQVLEVPPVRGSTENGDRQAYADARGRTWTREFYEQGSGHFGVVHKAVSPYVIRRGWKIPARLDDPITTDTPGQITATVVQDIKDSATGKYTLIPKGSQLVGAYDTRVLYGQERIPSAWDQLNFPNGDWMSLAAMPGADRTGQAGIPGEVNNHLWSAAGRSLLLTVTGAGSSLAIRGGLGGGYGYGLDDALRREGGRELGRQGRRVFERGYNRPPTITAKPGDIFLVQVTQNLVFSGPYSEGEGYELGD